MPIVNLGDLEIHFVEKGEGEVLLIFPDNDLAAAEYEEEITYFGRRFRAMSFDVPGTGASTRKVAFHDEIQLDPWNYRADLACHLLLALEIDTCWVLGSGFGALSALHFAGEQASLHNINVLAAVADSFLADLDLRTLHRWLDAREHYYVRRVRRMERLHGDDWRAVVDADTTSLRALANRGGYALPNRVLRGIDCPVLLSGNLRDPLTPGIAEQVARMTASLSDATIVLAGRSHHPHGDEHPWLRTAPERFRQTVDTFSEISLRGATLTEGN